MYQVSIPSTLWFGSLRSEEVVIEKSAPFFVGMVSMCGMSSNVKVMYGAMIECFKC